jgi:hypothetical protein
VNWTKQNILGRWGDHGRGEQRVRRIRGQGGGLTGGSKVWEEQRTMSENGVEVRYKFLTGRLCIP